MSGYKMSLKTFKRTKSRTKYIFPDCSEMGLEVSNRKEFGTFTNLWKLNNTLLKKQWIKEKIAMDVRKYFAVNENATYQNLWDAAKALIRGKFIA